MREPLCNHDLFETGGAPWAPLAGLPQEVPSLWFDADCPGNLYSAGKIIGLQPRYGTSSRMVEYPSHPGAAPVAFGTGKAIPSGPIYYGTTPQLVTYGGYVNPANTTIESAHVMAGTLPPADAVFDGTGYMGILNWYWPEFWPFYLRQNGAADWRFGISSGVVIEFAENIFPLAGQPFCFGERMKDNDTFLRFKSGNAVYEKTVNLASSTNLTQNLTVGAPGGYPDRLWKGTWACYGVMTQAAFSDEQIRQLMTQTMGSYGL